MPYTPTTWVEDVTKLGPTNLNKIEAGVQAAHVAAADALVVANRAEAALPGKAFVPGYGTTLPVSPVDGQEYILVDSVANPTYQWRMRWNAGSSLPHKWEFVGGSPKFVEVAVAEQLIAIVATDPPTPGPLFAVPRNGEYDVEIACRIDKVNVDGWVTTIAEIYDDATATFLQVMMSVHTGNVTTVGIAPWATGASQQRLSVIAGHTLKMRYRNAAVQTAGHSVTVRNRRLLVTPVRLS